MEKNLKKVVNIEEQYLSATFVKQITTTKKIKTPLTLVFLLDKNKGCGLLQLHEIVNPDLFKKIFLQIINQ